MVSYTQVGDSGAEQHRNSAPGHTLLGDLPPLSATTTARPRHRHQDAQHTHSSGLTVHVVPGGGGSGGSESAGGSAAVVGTRHSSPAFPARFLCSLGHHPMREPVRKRRRGAGTAEVGTKSAPVFERSSIVAWLREAGSVCPITGDALTEGDLEELPELRREIVAFHIRTALEKHALDSDGDDLYVFPT